MTRIAAFQQRAEKQSTVPCLITIPEFLGDNFGVDKKKNGDHFGVGIISGAVQISCKPAFNDFNLFRESMSVRSCFL